ncbi:MAG: hypothetical protein LUI12_04795 [Clostridiales bacterium]|nr:hypothetical protein [Clostridiales bacterium]
MKKGIISIISALAGVTVGAGASLRVTGKALNKKTTMSDKHLALFLLMNQWVAVKQEGKNLKDYFEKNGYKTIAIYGMSYVGERLVEELKDSDITIKYGIDKNADAIYSEIDMVTMDAELEEVDAVIVTPVFFFNEIEEELAQKLNCPIISIEDILYEVE